MPARVVTDDHFQSTPLRPLVKGRRSPLPEGRADVAGTLAVAVGIGALLLLVVARLSGRVLVRSAASA